MAKRKGSKKKNKKNIALGLTAIIIIAFTGFSYHEGYFPDEFYVGDGDQITAGAFNIQVFGTSKASKEDVMNILSGIICRYDIIAIQEIRDSSGTAIQELMDDVKAKNPAYRYVIGERLGRTSSKEQYAYIYNTAKVELTGTPQTYPEEQGTDPFHREPFIASFKSADGDFIATFATIHTDPDEAEEEIAALSGVAEYCTTILPDDEMVILMGDFNADCSYFNEDDMQCPLRASEYTWLIGNEHDTTTKTTVCTYDRIVVYGDHHGLYTGDSGVMRFDEIYGIGQELTEAVSDHYPVYAKFYTGKKGSAGISSTGGEDPETCTECSQGELRITSLNLVEDRIAITNTGDSSTDITNWRISNTNSTHSYVFPAASIEEGETFVLSTGYGENSRYSYYWNSDDDIWNDGGDTAILFDEKGNIIDSYSG